VEELVRTKGTGHLNKRTGRRGDTINRVGSGIQVESHGRILSVPTIMAACPSGTKLIMGTVQVETPPKLLVAVVP
jgi:hypothetical protein